MGIIIIILNELIWIIVRLILVITAPPIIIIVITIREYEWNDDVRIQSIWIPIVTVSAE